MIKYSQTTVFNVSAQTLVNTVNCVGVMGAGIALEFKLRYPEMYQDYVKQCKKGQVQVGHLNFYQGEEQPGIINFPTKKHWKYPSHLNWIESGLRYFLENYQNWCIKSIAFPKLGCDLGGLEWEEVNKIMQKYLSKAEDLEIIICLDTDPQAQGIEKQMLEILNSPQQWKEELTLLADIEREKILEYLPIKRFRNLQKIVTSEQYKGIFNFFYSLTLPQQAAEVSSPKEARLRLIGILQKLGVTPETMCKLTWENFSKEFDYYWLNLPENQPIIIFPEIWQDLVKLRPHVTNNTPILHDLRNPQKSLHISTLKKLIKGFNPS